MNAYNIIIIVLLSINCILMLLMLNAGGKNAKILEDQIERSRFSGAKQDLLIKTYEVAASIWAVMGIKADDIPKPKPVKKIPVKRKTGKKGQKG